jgi:hypothetical protein
MPAHGVGFANANPQALRDGAQHLVAGTVSKGVVDMFELVAIEKEHGNPAAVASCEGD